MNQLLKPLLLSHVTTTPGLGRGISATLAGLRETQSGLRACDFDTATLPTWSRPEAHPGASTRRFPDGQAFTPGAHPRLALLAPERGSKALTEKLLLS